MLSTGTGLAPFMSIVRDPDIYDKFDQLVLVHGVRQVDELAYHDLLVEHLPSHEFLGDLVSSKLRYYPTVTREAYKNMGRVTELIETGKLFEDLGVPSFDPAVDRVMICGSADMLRDLKTILEERGFKEGNTSTPGDFVIERAFAEK
jgi:ferredoxin--NADP+ reductase